MRDGLGRSKNFADQSLGVDLGRSREQEGNDVDFSARFMSACEASGETLVFAA
jgi:hypothetical protein